MLKTTEGWSKYSHTLVYFAASLSSFRTCISTAQLSGDNVVPGPGDNDGTGTANITLNPGQGEITYDISVSNVDNITGIHIHKADSGSSGPVVVPLTSTGELSGTVTGVDKDLMTDILKNPSGYYVQVHSTDFPAGAIRGQLTKK